jgi:hypothetical protein
LSKEKDIEEQDQNEKEEDNVKGGHGGFHGGSLSPGTDG